MRRDGIRRLVGVAPPSDRQTTRRHLAIGSDDDEEEKEAAVCSENIKS